MNHLKDQTSPYLLQHADNPVDWYPWNEEAFERADRENKPVFLSIGYSTCHWCHVMAQESFEDEDIAGILNQYYISVKVDREERPDLDSIYMSVCQAMTGSGGWPMTVFLTPDKRPFFAGTYYPKTSGYGRIGFRELLILIKDKWMSDRDTLINTADEMIAVIKSNSSGTDNNIKKDVYINLLDSAYHIYINSYDKEWGGFGQAPKFPAPHNLMYLIQYTKKTGYDDALAMAVKTLEQMFRGGIHDHVGGGFCRYSTDRYYLVPHFEKMMYDNALLIIAYSEAYQITEEKMLLEAAEGTAEYILREMTSSYGGFYSAQDADSEGVEGRYYLFEPSETEEVLGRDTAVEFNRYYNITVDGNYEGKSIPNLLRTEIIDNRFEDGLTKLYQYRRNRYSLNRDDKILTAWNGLMIAALSKLYRVTGKKKHYDAAVKAYRYITEDMGENDTLYVSRRNGRCGAEGFLDDYAYVIYGSLSLYEASLDEEYLKRARKLCDKAVKEYYDGIEGGFFMSGSGNEKLIIRPKETYDGAMPSGNSIMAYCLVQMYLITGDKMYDELAEKQCQYMSKVCRQYPAGYAMYLIALSDYILAPDSVTIVTGGLKLPDDISCRIPLNTVIRILEQPSEEYPLKDGSITYYICNNNSCKPPVNQL